MLNNINSKDERFNTLLQMDFYPKECSLLTVKFSVDEP